VLSTKIVSLSRVVGLGLGRVINFGIDVATNPVQIQDKIAMSN
tara:strand:+ start:834 stop:962 length:129 start_codon:yes stop_codon:yes gene_type:complete